MDDDRIWSFEESLWTADEHHYRESIDKECLMALPSEPHIVDGEQAVKAVASTPRWSKVELSERRVSRPQEGLIVIAYKAQAERDGATPYTAHCTSTYRWLAHEVWKVVQHSQVPPLMSGASQK